MLAQLAKGPVGVAVDGRFWWPYASGIYNGYCSSWSINHAVMVVGVGSDGTLGIRNSWGSSWGEQGYIRVARDYSCGASNYVNVPNLI